MSAKRSEAIWPRAKGVAMLSSPQEAPLRWPVEPGVEGCNRDQIRSEPETDRLAEGPVLTSGT